MSLYNVHIIVLVAFRFKFMCIIQMCTIISKDNENNLITINRKSI